MNVQDAFYRIEISYVVTEIFQISDAHIILYALIIDSQH